MQRATVLLSEIEANNLNQEEDSNQLVVWSVTVPKKKSIISQSALGEKQGLGAILPMDALGGAGLIALGMIYVGLNFPYSKETFEFVKKRIDQPKETTQALLLGAGTLILVNRANR